MSEPTLVQTSEGYAKEIKSKYGQKRTVKIDRKWNVFEGEELIGTISYGMITRERKSPGKMYVNARWQSPGWTYREATHVGLPSRSVEGSSKKNCVDRLMYWAERRRNSAQDS
jgi:hypothetical protein